MNKYISMFALSLFLSACGSSSEDNGGSANFSEPFFDSLVLSGKISTKNESTILVNGFSIDTSDSQIQSNIRNNQEITAGMNVIVTGEFDFEKLTGKAKNIRFQEELRGTISSYSEGENSFEILGQTVFFSNETVFQRFQDTTIDEGLYVSIDGKWHGNILYADYINIISDTIGQSDYYSISGNIENLNNEMQSLELNGTQIDISGVSLSSNSELIDFTEGNYVVFESQESFLDSVFLGQTSEIYQNFLLGNYAPEYVFRGNIILTDPNEQLISFNNQNFNYSDSIIVNEEFSEISGYNESILFGNYSENSNVFNVSEILILPSKEFVIDFIIEGFQSNINQLNMLEENFFYNGLTNLSFNNLDGAYSSLLQDYTSVLEGSSVKVIGYEMQDQYFLTDIQIKNSPDFTVIPEFFFIRGKVKSIDSLTFSLIGKEVLYNESTLFVDENGEDITSEEFLNRLMSEEREGRYLTIELQGFLNNGNISTPSITII